MLSDRLKRRKNTQRKKKAQGLQRHKGKQIILWKWELHGSKWSRFTKEQEAKGFLGAVSKVPLIDPFLK